MMEILVGLIPFALVALVVWLIMKHTGLSLDELLFSIFVALFSLVALGVVIVLAYTFGSAILGTNA